MSTLQEIESAIKQLGLDDVEALSDWLEKYRADQPVRAGDARVVQRAMRDHPHLEPADVANLEAAIASGRIPVSEPWAFNEGK